MRLVWAVIPLVLFGIIGISNIDARCLPDLDWPNYLCGDDGGGPEYSNEEWKANMEKYYEYKGTEWMEMKKIEMDNAIKNDVLLEWTEYTPPPEPNIMNRPHHNVWFYYYLHDEAPNWETFGNNMKKSPHEQVKRGILLSNVICNVGLELIFKSSDNFPACVKPQTAEKLIERGWATISKINDDEIPELFTETESQIPINSLDSNFILNYDISTRISNELLINFDAFDSERIRLKIFDQEFVIEKIRETHRTQNDFSWFGKITGMDYASVVIVVKNNGISGHIQTANSTFAINQLVNGNHVIQDLDLSLLPSEH